jgi:hypothetical protein
VLGKIQQPVTDMKTKIKIRTAAFVALCALALSPAAAFAKNSTKTATEHGVIKSVDSNAHQIVVMNQKTKANSTFQWNDRTQFTEHHKTVTASALAEGLPVYIKYARGSDTPMLQSVKLSPKKT